MAEMEVELGHTAWGPFQLCSVTMDNSLNSSEPISSFEHVDSDTCPLDHETVKGKARCPEELSAYHRS